MTEFSLRKEKGDDRHANITVPRKSENLDEAEPSPSGDKIAYILTSTYDTPLLRLVRRLD